MPPYRLISHLTPRIALAVPRHPPISSPLRLLPLRHSSTTASSSSSPSSPSQPDNFVHIVEVGPRDGLQNEKNGIIPVETKIELIRRLAGTGLQTIEAGAFVSPKWVPQMANSSDILKHIQSTPPSSPNAGSVAYNYLIPNLKGLHNFLAAYNPPPPNHSSSASAAATTEISLFTAATDSFSRANQNAPIADILASFPEIISLAKSHALRVRAYISVALGCPYEGPPTASTPHKVAEIATTLLEMGVDEVSIGDTTGMGTVPRTRELLATLSAAGVQAEDLALHFHDTFGMAVANTIVGLEAGIRKFDGSVGGLGGCPYSKGATGNVGTEDLVYLVESLGMRTGVDLEEVSRVGEWVSGKLGREDGQRETRVGKGVMAGVRRREAEKAAREM